MARLSITAAQSSQRESKARSGPKDHSLKAGGPEFPLPLLQSLFSQTCLSLCLSSLRAQRPSPRQIGQWVKPWSSTAWPPPTSPGPTPTTLALKSGMLGMLSCWGFIAILSCATRPFCADISAASSTLLPCASHPSSRSIPLSSG